MFAGRTGGYTLSLLIRSFSSCHSDWVNDYTSTVSEFSSSKNFFSNSQHRPSFAPSTFALTSTTTVSFLESNKTLIIYDVPILLSNPTIIIHYPFNTPIFQAPNVYIEGVLRLDLSDIPYQYLDGLQITLFDNVTVEGNFESVELIGVDTCVRFYQLSSGVFQFADCTTTATAMQRRKEILFG